MKIPKANIAAPQRLLLGLALLAWLPLSACGQEGGAFGFPQAKLAQLFTAGDPGPFLALEPERLADSGAYGPSAQYYLGLWLDEEGRGKAAAAGGAAGGAASAQSIDQRVNLLYRMAYERGSGYLRRESGLRLLDFLREKGLWDELLSFSADYGKNGAPEWRSERARLDALDALGRSDEEAKLVARLRVEYPIDAGRDAEALAYFAAAAALRSGGSGWAKAFRGILLEKAWGEYAGRAFELLGSEPRLAPRFSEAELAAVSMREAVSRRAYREACADARAAGTAVLGAARALTADAGKAFLYAGMAKEGSDYFLRIEERAKGSAAWTALFYRARFGRALGDWERAESLFARAAAKAAASGVSAADADSAAWYAADSGYQGGLAAAARQGSPAEGAAARRTAAEKAARRGLLKRLVEASASWHGPEAFVDLALGLFRDALRARDWELVEAEAESLGPKLPGESGSRLSYAAARAFELGLPGSGEAELDSGFRALRAMERFSALAEDRGAGLYYRLLAAWRAGIEIEVLPPSASVQAQGSPPGAGPAGQEGGAAPRGTAELLAGMARFGLPELALDEARGSELDEGSMRGLAAVLARLGRADSALRLELELADRPGFAASRADWELSYPRPYQTELREALAAGKIPEELAYGLLRSESAFKADAVSAAGAVGLSQLMPSTAAAQAKALGLSGYELARPRDNLAIGLAYYASLLGRAEGRPVRAMMAYNAGFGRLRTWLADSVDLPDDLLVEALGIEETRQYCRNIVQATAIYGELYYGKGKGETLGYLFGGR